MAFLTPFAALSLLAGMSSRPRTAPPRPPPPSAPPRRSSYFRVASVWSKAGVGTSVVLEPDDAADAAEHAGGGGAEGAEEGGGGGGGGGGGRRKGGPRIALDIGATPIFDAAIPAKVVCVSHGHVDHVGGIFNHARAHAVTYGGSAPTYYVPVELVPHLEAARRAMSAMDALCLDPSGGSAEDSDGGKGAMRRDESLMKMNVVGVRPGEEIELKGLKGRDGKRLLLRTFAVSHGSHPALGYLLLTRRPPGLKPEYRGLPGKDIGELVRSGVRVKEERGAVTAEAAYTGDTCKEGLLPADAEEEEDPEADGEGEDDARERGRRSRRYLHQAFREAPLLLCESTFLGPPSDAALRDMAPAKGHMHISDVVEVLRGHGWNVDSDAEDAAEASPGGEGDDGGWRLVLLHISARHHPAAHALDLLVDAVPPGLARRTDVAAASLLSDEERRRDGRGTTGGCCLADLVGGDGCVNLAEYGRWREGRAEERAS